MAAQKSSNYVEKKARSKKRKPRNDVSSASESDSDDSSEAVEEKSASPIPEPTPKWTKKSKKKAKRSPSPSPAVSDDVSMPDASILPEPVPTAASTKAKTVAAPSTEDFSAIYLRKITTELADDLDTVREAQDFKANSVPMLIHALKQGENMFSVEERIRIIGAVGQ